MSKLIILVRLAPVVKGIGRTKCGMLGDCAWVAVPLGCAHPGMRTMGFMLGKRVNGLKGAAVALCGMAVVCLPCLLGAGDLEGRVIRSLVPLPRAVFVMGSREFGTPRTVEVGAFRIGKYEVTVGEYVGYLNESGRETDGMPADVLRRGGRFRPKLGKAKHPVAGVSRADAEAYCRWISERTGLRVRLPTEAEWEYAARAGIHGARYPWGWGEPEGRARFAARGARRVGCYAPNAFGLYDMAGNVFEWCADPEEGGQIPARGGSWAERDPGMLRVSRRTVFPVEYQDLDVGFRIAADENEISLQARN